MMTDDGYRNRKFAPAYVPAAKQIVAKFASKCADCGLAIEAGETILWTPGQYKARVTHVACPKPEPVAPVAEVVVEDAKEAFAPTFEADAARALTTLPDAALETALRASEPGSVVERLMLAELDRRMDAAVEPAAVAPVAPVAPVAGPARIAIEDAGVYMLPNGDVVRVKANKAKTRTYASRWVAARHLDRLMEAGAHEHGEYVYEQGLVAEVARTGRKLSLEEAKAHSVRYGQCVRCGRKLTDGKSVEAGMGPVCITYFS